MYTQLLALLEAIRIYGKDAHYGMRGFDYLPWHQYMDQIVDPIADYVDEIKESIILARGERVPRGTEINAIAAAEYVPAALPNDDNGAILRALHSLISQTIRYIDEIAKTDPQFTQGNGDLLGRISSALGKHIGLLNMALYEIKDKEDALSHD